jgi:hypothetical protein
MRTGPSNAPIKEYFVRPRNDVNMHTRQTLSFLKSRFFNFAFEDYAHMHGIVAFLNRNKLKASDLYLVRPADIAVEYEPLVGRAYPVVVCGGTTTQTSLLALEYNPDGKTAHLTHITLDKFRQDQRDESLGANLHYSELVIEEVSSVLEKGNLVVFACIQRRNAILFDPHRKEYGVIVPISRTERDVYGGFTYFSSEEFSYNVDWYKPFTATQEANTETRQRYPDGICDRHVKELYLNVTDLLLPIGQYLYLRSTCKELKEVFLSNADLGNGFVRCALFYPNSVQETEQFDRVFVSVLSVKWKKNMIPRRYCEVFTVSLSSLVVPTDKIVADAIDVVKIGYQEGR